MQPFTRPLTREIDLAGERLALTLSADGMSIRPVGSRKPPHEIGWGELLCVLTRARPGTPPNTQDLAAAVAALKKGAAAKEATASAAKPEAAKQPAAAEQPSSAPEVTALLGRLEKWLAQHRPHYLKGLLPAASAAELEALPGKLGVPLPPPLHALLTWHNGQSDNCFSRFEQSWSLMSAGQIAAAKQELDADAAEPEHKSGWKSAWIPFLDNDAGDYVCLDTSPPAAPVREFWQDNPDQPVVAPSLAAWLENMVSAVEKGQYHEDPERGTFLRQ